MTLSEYQDSVLFAAAMLALGKAPPLEPWQERAMRRLATYRTITGYNPETNMAVRATEPNTTSPAQIRALREAFEEGARYGRNRFDAENNMREARVRYPLPKRMRIVTVKDRFGHSIQYRMNAGDVQMRIGGSGWMDGVLSQYMTQFTADELRAIATVLEKPFLDEGEAQDE